jgi:C4-dicarboxylate-specific signal transduction histidine kinase
MPPAGKSDAGATLNSPLPQRIQGDPVRIQQILNNLLSNAVKFTQSGSVNLICDIATDDALPLKITVEDSGIGIRRNIRKEFLMRLHSRMCPPRANSAALVWDSASASGLRS